MFDSLSTRLQDVFRTLRGEARLSEPAVDAALREIRMALLEADVNFKVVKAFVDRVRERAGRAAQPDARPAGREDRAR
jgi:signal recognition particle subunit SRP54